MITEAQKKYLVDKLETTMEDFIMNTDHYAEEENGYVNGLSKAVELIKSL